MVRVLALDISCSSTGWALLQGERGPAAVPTIVSCGTVGLDRPVIDHAGGHYPWSYVEAVEELALRLSDQVFKISKTGSFDFVIIEETNGSKNRYTQKSLEFAHLKILEMLRGFKKPVVYISTGVWRRAVGVVMSKEDKKQNAKLSWALKHGKTKKDVGIKGKTKIKHVAVRWANEVFKPTVPWKMKDNDICDAIAQGTAYLRGAEVCTGCDHVASRKGKKTNDIKEVAE